MEFVDAPAAGHAADCNPGTHLNQSESEACVRDRNSRETTCPESIDPDPKQRRGRVRVERKGGGTGGWTH